MNERPSDELDPSMQATEPSAHEREVAQYEEGGSDASSSGGDVTADPGRRPTAEEDLAADQGRGGDDDDEGLL
jgi:hypothetical protein